MDRTADPLSRRRQRKRKRDEFERTCAEMAARGYSAWLIAQRLGVSENKVLRAIERVRAGRYDG